MLRGSQFSGHTGIHRVGFHVAGSARCASHVATGAAAEFRADVVAVAKRDLSAGELLDGEGGYTVSGGLRPALLSVRNGYVPLGLAHQVKLIRSVVKDQAVSWDDIEIDPTTSAYRLRKEVEAGVAQ